MSLSDKKAISIDVSDLEAPAPLTTVLEHLNNLNHSCEYLNVKHRIEPKGLYPYLTKMGFTYSIVSTEANFSLNIWKEK